MHKQYSKNICFTKKDILSSLIFALLFILSVYPSFVNTGKLTVQIVLTCFLSSLVVIFSLIIKVNIRIIALSIDMFLAVFIIIAIVWQIVMQIENIMQGATFDRWIYLFYFDKPLSVGLVWFTVIIIFTLIRIFKKYPESRDSTYEYDMFFNIASRGFFIYYALLLIYSFILIRSPVYDVSDSNFIPFRTMQTYNYNYEIFMYFFGNLLYFTPAGFYIKVIKNRIKPLVFILLPITISASIELSQLIFKNGNCDIDDVILNSIGFYLGFAVKSIMDYIILKRTSGSVKTVFNWKFCSEYKQQ